MKQSNGHIDNQLGEQPGDDNKMAIRIWPQSNDNKTKICVYQRSPPTIVKVRAGNAIIKSKPSMNVLSVVFDSRLQWFLYVNSAEKAKKAKCAIQRVSKCFNKVELTNLLRAKYFSILNFN